MSSAVAVIFCFNASSTRRVRSWDAFTSACTSTSPVSCCSDMRGYRTRESTRGPEGAREASARHHRTAPRKTTISGAQRLRSERSEAIVDSSRRSQPGLCAAARNLGVGGGVGG